jgi:undecaprenyl-diphosphatase
MTVDHAVADFFATHHSHLATQVAWAVTTVGDEATLAVASLALLAFTFLTGRRRETLMVVVAMGGAAALTLGVKDVVRRTRPGAHYVVGAVDHSYSFPSGHTLDTTVFLTVLVATAWPALAGPRSRAIACAAAALVAISVGLTRLYLGYHWATDVIGGLVLGATWAGLVVLLAHRWRVAVVPAHERGVSTGESVDPPAGSDTGPDGPGTASGLAS